jgi:hypothetical protein
LLRRSGSPHEREKAAGGASSRDNSPRSPLMSPKTPRNVSSPIVVELLDRQRGKYIESKQ